MSGPGGHFRAFLAGVTENVTLRAALMALWPALDVPAANREIRAGRVLHNGETARQPGKRNVCPDDTIELLRPGGGSGGARSLPPPLFVLFHKPTGCVSTLAPGGEGGCPSVVDVMRHPNPLLRPSVSCTTLPFETSAQLCFRRYPLGHHPTDHERHASLASGDLTRTPQACCCSPRRCVPYQALRSDLHLFARLPPFSSFPRPTRGLADRGSVALSNAPHALPSATPIASSPVRAGGRPGSWLQVAPSTKRIAADWGSRHRTQIWRHWLWVCDSATRSHPGVGLLVNPSYSSPRWGYWSANESLGASS